MSEHIERIRELLIAHGLSPAAAEREVAPLRLRSVYAVEYCDCIYESAYGVMSLHETKEGAYHAMRAHKLSEAEQDRRDALAFGHLFDPGYKSHRYTDSRVREIPVWPAGIFGTPEGGE